MTERLKAAMEAARVLREARDFLSDRERWTVGAYWSESGAGHNNGEAGKAIRACALGAVAKYATPQMSVGDDRAENGITAAMQHPAAQMPIHALEQAIIALGEAHPAAGCGEETVYTFNDSHSHEDVLAVFDLASEEQCKIVQKLVKETGENHD